MAKSRRVAPNKIGKPMSRRVIREGLDDHKPTPYERQQWSMQQEHNRQAKLWYKQGKDDGFFSKPENPNVPAEYESHYKMGYNSGQIDGNR